MHHRQFHFIRRADESFLWINIFIFMFVAMIPFSTQVMANYDSLQRAALIFDVNLLIVGLGYMVMWQYATRRNRLIDPGELSQRTIRMVSWGTAIVPLFSIVAIGLSFVNSAWNEAIFILCPLAAVYFRRRLAGLEDIAAGERAEDIA
jgi:uncharacterized membrane protein